MLFQDEILESMLHRETYSDSSDTEAHLKMMADQINDGLKTPEPNECPLNPEPQ